MHASFVTIVFLRARNALVDSVQAIGTIDSSHGAVNGSARSKRAERSCWTGVFNATRRTVAALSTLFGWSDNSRCSYSTLACETCLARNTVANGLSTWERTIQFLAAWSNFKGILGAVVASFTRNSLRVNLVIGDHRVAGVIFGSSKGIIRTVETLWTVDAAALLNVRLVLAVSTFNLNL